MAREGGTVSRPLAEVLLDLASTREDWDKALKNAETAAGEGNPRLETEYGDRMSDLDNKLDDLRVEFREVFRERTGVAWSNVEAAQMTGAL